MKMLKLRLSKFDLALVGQVVYIEDPESFESTAHVNVDTDRLFLLNKEVMLSRGKRIDIKYFDNNAERDRYLNKIIDWISIEQFSQSENCEVGKFYTFKYNKDNPVQFCGELLALLPENFPSRYIVKAPYSNSGWDAFDVVCPNCFAPQVDGDVYSWSLPQ